MFSHSNRYPVSVTSFKLTVPKYVTQLVVNSNPYAFDITGFGELIRKCIIISLVLSDTIGCQKVLITSIGVGTKQIHYNLETWLTNHYKHKHRVN